LPSPWASWWTTPPWRSKTSIVISRWGNHCGSAILDGAQQIAAPAFVSTLCICVVFLPMFMLSGVARYLFVPMAEAVVFAMLASYFLSRTLVPTMVMYLFHSERKKQRTQGPDVHPGVFRRFHNGFEASFERFRERYVGMLEWCLGHRTLFVVVFLGFCLASLLLIPILGADLFPTVDAGQIRLHLRAPIGTRVEETASVVDLVEQSIRRQIPPSEIAGILDNIGFPISGINLTLSDSGVIGTSDAEVLISLTQDHHTKPVDYIRTLRPHSPPTNFPASSSISSRRISSARF
jgi:multidrug efflux pump subunit AcrB